MFSLQGSLMTSTVEYQEMLPLASSLQQPVVNSSDVLEIERPASRASNISSETDTSNTSSYLERWDDKHVKLLISCYGDHKHLFGKGKTTKREIFSRIAYSFNRQSELMVTGDQCMRKWTKLENKFKETEDHNNQTGNDKRKIKFYDELSECIGSDPKVTPVLTLESENGTGNGDIGSTEHSASEESSGSAHGRGKRPTKKRKSHSSAAEMLSFMQEYSAKREKVEEEKVKLMREMQEEKKNFFSQFLEIMKNK